MNHLAKSRRNSRLGIFISSKQQAVKKKKFAVALWMLNLQLLYCSNFCKLLFVTNKCFSFNSFNNFSSPSQACARDFENYAHYIDSWTTLTFLVAPLNSVFFSSVTVEKGELPKGIARVRCRRWSQESSSRPLIFRLGTRADWERFQLQVLIVPQSLRAFWQHARQPNHRSSYTHIHTHIYTCYFEKALSLHQNFECFCLSSLTSFNWRGNERNKNRTE